MLKSRTFHFSLGALIGAIVVAASFHTGPCGGGSLIMLNLVPSFLPCPAPVAAPPFARATRNVTLILGAPTGTVRAALALLVTLALRASGTPVNALDVTLSYPAALLRVTAKDESLSPFAIRLGNQERNALDETIQVQPNPGIEGLVPIALFTFQALTPGTATITIASSSRVLANDGFGTDVLESIQNASITIK